MQINDKSTRVVVDDIEVTECPVSTLRRQPWGAELRSMVTEIGKAQRVKELTGAWLGGMDAGKWDARFFDAVEIAEMERKRLDRAIDDACDVVRKRPAGGGLL